MNSNFITYSNFPLWYVCKVDSLQEKFRGYTLLSFNSHSNIWMGFSRKQDDFGDEGKIQSSPKNLAKNFMQVKKENIMELLTILPLLIFF